MCKYFLIILNKNMIDEVAISIKIKFVLIDALQCGMPTEHMLLFEDILPSILVVIRWIMGIHGKIWGMVIEKILIILGSLFMLHIHTIVMLQGFGPFLQIQGRLDRPHGITITKDGLYQAWNLKSEGLILMNKLLLMLDIEILNFSGGNPTKDYLFMKKLDFCRYLLRDFWN